MVPNIIHMMELAMCLGNYDGYQANLDCIQQLGTYVDCEVQSSTVVQKALYSMKELVNSYKCSGELEFSYLQGGVKECERIETSLSIDMAVIGISHLKVSW